MIILQSASKLVFILLTLALIGGLFTKLIDPKDFVGIVSMVFVYYFTKKNEIPQV